MFKNSKLSQYNQINSLILAELLSCHKEEIIHGIPAPTVSFTLSMMLADAVILALLELIETDSLKRKKLFGLKHPGGSIGANLAQEFNQNNTNRVGIIPLLLLLLLLPLPILILIIIVVSPFKHQLFLHRI